MNEIKVWGLNKKAAWWIFGLLTLGTGTPGLFGLLAWYYYYNKEKDRDDPEWHKSIDSHKMEREMAQQRYMRVTSYRK